MFLSAAVVAVHQRFLSRTLLMFIPNRFGAGFHPFRLI